MFSRLTGATKINKNKNLI